MYEQGAESTSFDVETDEIYPQRKQLLGWLPSQAFIEKLVVEDHTGVSKHQAVNSARRKVCSTDKLMLCYFFRKSKHVFLIQLKITMVTIILNNVFLPLGFYQQAQPGDTQRRAPSTVE